MKLKNIFALKTTKAVTFISSTAIALLAASTANAASLKVLWHGYSSHNTNILELADRASTFDPEGDGSLDWNLTIWNSQEDPTPDFSDYDVLAIGTNGGNNINPILNNKEAISTARGSRTFLSGQDADQHYVGSPGPRPDGPLGFLVNAVNWAGSGEGMGIVSLVGTQWWLKDRSFLKDELQGYVSYFDEENVVIPIESSDFPVNEGLTTAGLSNWRKSAHAGFNKNIPGYLSINDADSRPGYSVTIVTAEEADGDTTGPQPVPEPSSILGLFALGGLGVRSLLKRKSQL